MKDHILHNIIILLMMPLFMVSCISAIDDVDEPNSKGQITLTYRTPGVMSRAETADNEIESYMSHIDVVIYEYKAGSYIPFH
ncbi:MAG: hypothetical protein IIU50_05145, partial [Bacteroidaceae bacterium]|nr:hypothetical protein [Bacteroidaceae bacterium]